MNFLLNVDFAYFGVFTSEWVSQVSIGSQISYFFFNFNSKIKLG